MKNQPADKPPSALEKSAPAAFATSPPTFPIAGIGACTGMREAFDAFFHARPADSGILLCGSATDSALGLHAINARYATHILPAAKRWPEKRWPVTAQPKT